jgi:topoisomerase-4 subunit A
MKTLPNGGRGVLAMSLEKGDTLIATLVTGHDGVRVKTVGRGGKESFYSIPEKEMLGYIGKRARKGKSLPIKAKAAGFDNSPSERP